MSAALLDHRMAEYREALGLDPVLDFHSRRRSCVTHLIEDGWDLRFVQEQVGHEHASTTWIYTGVSSDFRVRTLRRALDAIVANAVGDAETPRCSRCSSCYAQPLARIQQLTLHDIATSDDGQLLIRLGDPPTPVPAPFDEVIRPAIKAAGGFARVQDVSGEMAITVGAASKLVDRLERDGLAQRTAHPTDRRSSIVSLSERGSSVLTRADAAAEEHLGAALGDVLPEDRRERLLDELTALRAHSRAEFAK